MAEELYYKMRGSWFTDMADCVRTMAGTSSKLTPEEMLYWLERVKYIPQGNAESILTLSFSSHAVGMLPVVVKGAASSVLELAFTSSAKEYMKPVYTITENLTGWHSTGNPATIAEGESVTLSFYVSAEGDGTGSTISVVGAEYVITQQDASYIEITLSNPTGNVSVTIAWDSSVNG